MTEYQHADLIDKILRELDGEEWNGETCDAIAQHLRRAGFEVRELGDAEEAFVNGNGPGSLDDEEWTGVDDDGPLAGYVPVDGNDFIGIPVVTIDPAQSMFTVVGHLTYHPDGDELINTEVKKLAIDIDRELLYGDELVAESLTTGETRPLTPTERLDFLGEYDLDHFDDDPNPYHGTYSED